MPATPIYTADAQGAYRADNHGWFIATSGGRVFQAGPSGRDALDHDHRRRDDHRGRRARDRAATR